MIAAHDVYAETNPAFCAAVISKFCEGHSNYNKSMPSLPVVYMSLPLVLSEDLTATFEGCNKDTGLLVWIDRNPKVLNDLAMRVNKTLQITTDAIRFGCLYGILKLNSDGQLLSTNLKIPLAVSAGPGGNAFKRARLLGSWFAGTGSAHTVFEALGVSV